MPNKPPITVDSCIEKLWDIVKNPKHPFVLKKKEILFLINSSKPIISSQPVFLELMPPLVVCGDVHGQFFDLLRIFKRCGDPMKTNYLFLGDYVDRGRQSINTLCLLLCYKIKYPENFFLLRGNHESSNINKIYGFYEECRNYYNGNLWKEFNDLFEWFPISAMIDNRILCLHGGISPDLNDISQLREITRPTTIPETGFLCDLLWSDPENIDVDFSDNERGTSYVFGEAPLGKFLQKNGLDLLVRAHQAINAGFDFPYLPSRSAVTIFSAPNYCGMLGNHGAVMTVSEQMICKVITFEPKHASVITDGL